MESSTTAMPAKAPYRLPGLLAPRTASATSTARPKLAFSQRKPRNAGQDAISPTAAMSGPAMYTINASLRP
jgi:hypothetical protein